MCFALLRYISYPLLQNKLPQKAVAYNNPHFLMHFFGLGTWAQLRWSLCFRVSERLQLRCWLGLGSHLNALLGKDLLLSSQGGGTADLVSHLVVGWNCPQLLAMCAFPMWKFASLMQANKAVEKVCQQHRGLSFINLIIGVTSITFAVFHWLEATPRSRLYSKGRDYSGCEYGK